MKEKVGRVFSVASDNVPVPGCTVSKEVHSGENTIIYFSLARNTDISAETYPTHKLLIVAEGQMEVYTPGTARCQLDAGQAAITPINTPVGVCSETGTVYTEINLGKDPIMNEAIKPGEAFKLADLLPYQEGKIVNMDLVRNEHMKFMVMSFDAGTGLTEHSAPGEAIIFALDGEGVITYEGTDHAVKAGENFHFAKGGLHAVTATTQFKMALLLTLD